MEATLEVKKDQENVNIQELGDVEENHAESD